MDLVKIGFVVSANGLKDANKEIDNLLAKADKLNALGNGGGQGGGSGTSPRTKKLKDETNAADKMIQKQQTINQLLPYMDKGVANLASSFWLVRKEAQSFNKFLDIMSGQDAIIKQKKQTEALVKEQEKQAKALEKQKIVGEYLSKGLDKSTATSLANFKQLKAGVVDTNTMFTLLGNNHSLDKTNKQAKAVNDSLNKMRLNLDFVGKGFSASEQAQLRQLKANGASNAELEKAIDLIKKKKQAEVLADYQNQKASLSREWLSAYDKEIAARVAKEKEAVAKIQQIRDDHEAKSKQSLGGGILDQIGQKNKDLEQLKKKYQEQEKAAAQKVIDDAEKAREKSNAANQKQHLKNMELLERETAAQKAAAQKVIALEQTKAKYIKEGYGKTDAGRLARLEVSGADVTTLNNYKDAIKATTRATQALNPVVQEATVRHNNFLGQIKGIAAYALLSTAIYGAMTATFGLIAATIKMADEYTSTQQRLKLYIKDAQTLGEVNTFLAKSAIQNNVGLRENAALYAKLAPAMQRIGANTAATNQVVDAFGKSLRIGGATAMEAASATIQFAQAMASGKLAGDEFRSISEASPRFLKAIADGSGIAAEKLKAMSSAGALTTEVIARALVKEYHNLTKESESLGYTLEQGTNALKTGFMSLVGEFNEGAGITKMLGSFMAGLGVSMIDGAKAAKENGEAVRVWFIRNAENISTLVDAFKLLSTVIISRYVAVLVIARYESMKLTWQTSALAAAQTNAMRSFVIGATVVTAFGRAVSAAGAAFAFMGGLPGLILTVLGVVAAYALFNKESEKTTKSLQEEGETIEDVVAKYKELTKIQQEKALLDQRKSVEESTEAYIDQKDALITAASRMKYFNEMTGFQSDVIDKLVLWYKDGKITLEQFSGAMKAQNSLTQESKDKITDLASGVYEADKKAASAAKVLEALGLATKGAGNEADIAGSKYNKFLTDAETQININKLAAQYMVKYNLDQAKAVDLAKQALALQAQKKDITPAEIKSQQELLKSETAMADITKARADAEKKLNKEKKDENELKRLEGVRKNYQDQIDIVERLNMFKANGVNYDVAKIAAEKDYYDAYTDTAKALEVAEAKKALARFDMLGDLENETLLLTKVLALQEQGVSYDVARSLAQAGFAANSEGLLAASQSMHNTLVAQQYSIADQIKQQTLLNYFLSQGLSLEEATVRASYARLENIQKEAGLKGLSTEQRRLRAETVSMQKQLEAKKALSDVEEKINALNIERAFLTAATMGVYTAATISAAKLLATTEGLLYTDAQRQLIRQEENDLLNERIKNQLSLNSLLSGESETLRDVKNTYLFITDEEAKRIEANRKLVTLAEAYASKMEQQKTLPIGDFSNVNFDVFGDIGNPFKEALDGLNAFVSGNTKLTESLSLVAEQIESLKSQAFVEDMFGNTDAANALTKQIEGQVNLEKDLQKQKEETNDIAYGQGLKFAKSFFKENSKGYKVVSALEMALQAKKIAFTLWEKKDTIAKYALELKGMLANAATFVSTTATKIAAQMGFNVAQAQGAVASAAQAPPPVGFASAAAMIALLAGIGIAISGGGGGSYVDTSNQGTGTVFGDKEAQSASIANSIDLLSENSDLMLPLTSAMLRSLKNIESSIGGVTNLILRQATGGEGFNIQEGFNQNGFGKALANPTVGALGGLLGGGALGATVGVSALMGGLGMGAMGALAIAGPIGLAVGALLGPMLGKALGSLFGTKTTVKASGLFGGDQKLGDILSEGFNLQEYIDIQTKKKTLGITTSTKNKTKYSKADAELSNQFTLIFGGFYDSILSATDILGADMSAVKTNLENAVISIGKINLKGLSGDEIQEKLEAVFGAAADSLAKQAFGSLEDFQTVGEGYFETLVKVASAVEEAAYYTDRLNVTAINYNDIINKQADDLATEIVRQSYLTKVGISTVKGGMTDLVNSFDGTAEEITDFISTLEDLQEQLFMTGKSGNYLTSSMILGAGGLDSLASGLDAYFEMLSPAEQAAELTRRLTKEFAIFGKELPSDVKAFRNLVNSIDVSTEAGQKLYGQIIALAPEFNDLQDSIKSANSEVNALVQSLRDLAEQARGARGETDQTRNLASIRSEFGRVSNLAMQGDIAAANRLVELGKDLMGVSKTYATSNEDYARDLALIQRAATVAADLQANGLGTTVTPTLTTTAGTVTTPTIETTNTTMSSEMKQMREEFNAGILAVAKFVQKLDARTERWDDGNRVMVGITPEIDDVPLNVKVVT